MSDSLEILRLRILVLFLNEGENCTVMGISRTLNVSKQTISRVIIAMEQDGLIDRSIKRHPVLTKKGKELALQYAERIDISLNHLMYEGVNIESAKSDAFRWALYNTEDTMEVIRSSEKKYKAKYALRGEDRFSGAMLGKELSDGEYTVPFVIYREHVQNGSNISMANKAFEHPCILTVKNSVGILHLKAIQTENISASIGEKLQGILQSMKYNDNGMFISAEKSGNVFSFPLAPLSFVNVGEGIGQVLHGTTCLKMQSTVGDQHMPESTAIFTILI